jgi:hypothetical protein
MVSLTNSTPISDGCDKGIEATPTKAALLLEYILVGSASVLGTGGAFAGDNGVSLFIVD